VDREEGGLSLERVVRAVLARRRTFGLAAAIGSALLGAGAMAIPPAYKASVVMTIDPGRYPNDFLRPNVIPGLDTRLGGMEKMLESAPVIEELRARTGLASKDAPPGGVMDALGLAGDAVDAWRKAFKFEVLQGLTPTGHKTEEALLVEVSYKHSDPAMAAKVVNACAMRANEENNLFRRAFVDEVVRFVKKAEERAKDSAHAREEAWNVFKTQNMDKLPEQEPYIAQRLSQLRIRYADLKSSERFAESRLEQLTSERGLLVAQIALNVQIAQAVTGDTDSPRELRLELARLQLERERTEDELRKLEGQFLDTLPQVKITREQLEATNARIHDVQLKLMQLGLIAGGVEPTAPALPTKKRPPSLFDDPETKAFGPGGIPKVPVVIPRKDGDAPPKEAPPAPPKDDVPKAAVATGLVASVLSRDAIDEKTIQKSLDEMSYRLVVSNPGYSRIRAIDFSLKEARESTKELALQREECLAETRKAEEQLAAIPEVRQRLDALGRALFEAREDFRRLSDQLDNAEKALEVENEGKGEQFRVIDFARPPTRPSGPGRPVFVGLAIAMALAAAAAFCVMADSRARAEAEAAAAPVPQAPSLAAAPPTTPTAERPDAGAPDPERKDG
jgi:uncharacterized protein involved in exopolysaccharide biosynthesis